MYADVFMELTMTEKFTVTRNNIDRFKQVFIFAFGSQNYMNYLLYL